MIYKVRITNPAQNEMREVFRYIAEDLQNPIAAVRRISQIDEKIQSLKMILLAFLLCVMIIWHLRDYG